MSIYAPDNQQAWTSFTPTITAGTGTFTTTSATCKYAQNGKLVTFRMDITITTVGTGATSVIATLPVTSAVSNGAIAYGREDGVSGKMIQGKLASSTTVSIFNYDNTAPIAAGAVCRIVGVYEAA